MLLTVKTLLARQKYRQNNQRLHVAARTSSSLAHSQDRQLSCQYLSTSRRDQRLSLGLEERTSDGAEHFIPSHRIETIVSHGLTAPSVTFVATQRLQTTAGLQHTSTACPHIHSKSADTKHDRPKWPPSSLITAPPRHRHSDANDHAIATHRQTKTIPTKLYL